MGIYSYGYKAGKKLLQKVFKPQKTTGTEVIKSVKPNVNKSKLKQVTTDVKLSALKAKGKMKRSFQKMEEDIDPARTKLRQTTQKLAGEKVTKSGVSKGKDRIKKMGGGMMGRRMGYSEGSSKGKVPTTPKEKSLAKLAPPKDRITFGDVVAGRKKGKA